MFGLPKDKRLLKHAMITQLGIEESPSENTSKEDIEELPSENSFEEVVEEPQQDKIEEE